MEETPLRRRRMRAGDLQDAQLPVPRQHQRLRLRVILRIIAGKQADRPRPGRAEPGCGVRNRLPRDDGDDGRQDLDAHQAHARGPSGRAAPGTAIRRPGRPPRAGSAAPGPPGPGPGAGRRRRTGSPSRSHAGGRRGTPPGPRRRCPGSPTGRGCARRRARGLERAVGRTVVDHQDVGPGGVPPQVLQDPRDGRLLVERRHDDQGAAAPQVGRQERRSDPLGIHNDTILQGV